MFVTTLVYRSTARIGQGAFNLKPPKRIFCMEEDNAKEENTRSPRMRGKMEGRTMVKTVALDSEDRSRNLRVALSIIKQYLPLRLRLSSSLPARVQKICELLSQHRWYI